MGAGISGLAAAHFYRAALGTRERILILDNHDDFGGHAKRNEFRHKDRTYIGFGGTMGIETPYPYSYAAKSLVRELGIAVERKPGVCESRTGDEIRPARGDVLRQSIFSRTGWWWAIRGRRDSSITYR